MALTLRTINRFPVKSCRGEQMPHAVVEPWGLAGDRRWMLVDDDGVVLTARKYGRLLLVTPALTEFGLHLTCRGAPDLDVPTPGPDCHLPVRVWDDELLAARASEESHAWFSTILGRSAWLVYLDDPTRRHPNPDFAAADDLVSLADGYPLLLTTVESLDRLNDLIAEDGGGDDPPLPMIRFRPSVVVSGAPAWAEDGWRRLRIGDAGFRVVKGCDRCVLTTIDPVTAQRGREPLVTLARHRRWDGAIWFGVNLVPDTPGSTITVGDEVEILDAVVAPDGPLR